ncbi:MAG: hypothetical protein Q9184_002294 [Pyrenodesmia sp. 2 TL-2023]
MVLSVVVLAVSAFWIAYGNSLSQSADQPDGILPVVDLGYTLQQATSYNDEAKSYNFFNIRYGQPPIGPLRFAAPVAAAEDRRVQRGDVERRCYQANPGWLQIAGKFIGPYLTNSTTAFYQQYPSPASFPRAEVPPAGPTETEDCLFLDVLVPEPIFNRRNAGKRAPVLVWIYGGGFAGGYKTQYPPTTLLKQSYSGSADGVVFVALNYRLGAFGWLPGGGAVANAGLLDQRLALKWVQDHIASFGGDPKQVTVMGQSAGAGSIMYHLTSSDDALKTPLFQQAILQSPFFFPDQGQKRSEEVAERFLYLSGADKLSDARALPAETLRAANYRMVLDAPYGQFTFGPVVDGGYIKQTPVTALQRGIFPKSLPMVIGHNALEGIGFTYPWIPDDVAFRTYLAGLFPGAPPAVLTSVYTSVYPPVRSGPDLPYSNDLERAALMTSEVLVTCNTYLLALAYGNSTYNYLFNVFPGLHGDDLHYTFGPDPSTKSREVQLAIQSYITQFSQTGDPNGKGQPPFRRYGSRNEILSLNPARVEGILDPAASQRCLLLRERGLL